MQARVASDLYASCVRRRRASRRPAPAPMRMSAGSVVANNNITKKPQTKLEIYLIKYFLSIIVTQILSFIIILSSPSECFLY